MKFSSIVLTLLSLQSVVAFTTNSRIPSSFFARSQINNKNFSLKESSSSASGSSGSGGDAAPNNGIPKQSRLEGNTRAPTEQEQKVMDEMIMKMANAKPYELPNAVRRAFRVVSSPPFFLRIVQLMDDAEDEVEKEKLNSLATNLVSTIEAVVSTTEDQLDERAKDVEMVVKAASEPDSGEFLVPLSQDRVIAMRDTMATLDPASLDESFLSTVDAWMNKSHQDGMDGMVGILQKVLQMYAGTAISRARSQQNLSKNGDAKSELFEKLLVADTDVWDMEIQQGLAATDDLTSTALMSEIQRTIEGVVLGLENGSMAQRVQAEFLRELVSRVEAYQQKENK
mmetsp:Transcript_21046/g.29705  ORF Transcript_21046/g.29705 Transcript_21046/m.29705 type:complete len:340 (+) Transcript_21046:196-1215(+)